MTRPRKSAPPASTLEGRKTIYQTVAVLPQAAKEANGFLSPGQYLHVKDLVKQLVGFGRQQYESELDIQKFHEFWELRDKGGTLGKLNVRIYFFFDSETNEVIVLSSYKKEDDGNAPRHILIRLRNRLRMYKRGEFGNKVIRYQRPTT